MVAYEARDGREGPRPAIMTVDRDATRIAGRPLFRGGTTDLIDAIARLRRRGGRRLIVTPNVDQVLMSERDPDAAEAFRRASLLLADGAPLVALARLLGDRHLVRHTGADLLELVVQHARMRDWHVAIVGGAEGIAHAAVERLRRTHPGARLTAIAAPRLVGVDDPAGGIVVSALASTCADVVFLCFGFPRQEAWWAHWGGKLPDAVYVGAGAAVDFAAGVRSRAPEPIQKLGLEWTWRLAQEPRRLAHRYLVRGPRFLATVIRSVIHSRREART